jgi:hypothetical protein
VLFVGIMILSTSERLSAYVGGRQEVLRASIAIYCPLLREARARVRDGCDAVRDRHRIHVRPARLQQANEVVAMLFWAQLSVSSSYVVCGVWRGWAL